MVHVSGTPIPLPDILEFMGPGDIVTHAFNGNPEGILDNQGKIRPQVKEAAERGVIMDVAHAGVHCDVDVVKSALEQDFFPDTISTDIHIAPPGRTVYLMNDLVSKFHAMGMSLPDAVAASTIKPAQVPWPRSRDRLAGPGHVRRRRRLRPPGRALRVVRQRREQRRRQAAAGHLHVGPGRSRRVARRPPDADGQLLRSILSS